MTWPARAEPNAPTGVGSSDLLGSCVISQCKNSIANKTTAITSKIGDHQCMGTKNKACRERLTANSLPVCLSITIRSDLLRRKSPRNQQIAADTINETANGHL